MDTQFILATQPGSFKTYPKNDEFFVKTDKGYLALLHISDFPIRPLFLWINDFFVEDVDITLQFKMEKNISLVRTNIGRSIQELDTQENYVTSGTAGEDAATQIEDLLEINEGITRNNNQIINAFVVLQLFNLDPNKLLDQVVELQHHLQNKGFTGSFRLFQNDQMYDFVRIHNQYNHLIDDYGKQMPLETFANGISFEQQSFYDDSPYSNFLGQSKTDGVVLLDTWKTTAERASYDELIVGKKGSGKSTFMKLKILNEFKRGTRQFILDAELEYYPLVLYVGGVVVDMKKHRLNPLEIFDSDFTSHLSKLSLFHSLLFRDTKQNVLDALHDFIVQYYKLIGMTNETDYSTYKQTEYPTYSMLLRVLRKTLYSNGSESGEINEKLHPLQVELLLSVEMLLKKVTDAEYQIFDGHTTFEFIDESLVCFDVSEVSKYGYKNAIYFLMTSMMWEAVAMNRKDMDTNPIRTKIWIDECASLLKSTSITLLEFVEAMVRRGRKYLASTVFASQLLKDFLPTGEGPIQDLIRAIFSLTEYKYIMQVSEEDMKLVEEYLPNVTETERNLIRAFNEYGDCLLVMQNVNIPFQVYLPEQYEAVMNGALTHQEDAEDV